MKSFSQLDAEKYIFIANVSYRFGFCFVHVGFKLAPFAFALNFYFFSIDGYSDFWMFNANRCPVHITVSYINNHFHCKLTILPHLKCFAFLMMTSSNGNIFRVTGPLCGEFTAQRPVMRSFDVFFDLRLNKRLSKQS